MGLAIAASPKVTAGRTSHKLDPTSNLVDALSSSGGLAEARKTLGCSRRPGVCRG